MSINAMHAKTSESSRQGGWVFFGILFFGFSDVFSTSHRATLLELRSI